MAGKKISRLIGKERDPVRAAKKRLAAALSKHGVVWVERIIEAGPMQKIGSNQKQEPPRACVTDVELSEARQLFQWAMTFAADRCGMPKQTGIEIDAAADGIPPIQVNIVGHARPADS